MEDLVLTHFQIFRICGDCRGFVFTKAVGGGGETERENVRGAESSCEGGTSQIFIRYRRYHDLGQFS